MTTKRKPWVQPMPSGWWKKQGKVESSKDFLIATLKPR